MLVLTCFTMAFVIQLYSTFNLINGYHSPLSFSLPIGSSFTALAFGAVG